MLKHGWDKHIVAFLQVLAQKHSAGVNIGGSPSTLLDIEVVKAEFAVHLHLEIKLNEMLHSTQIIVLCWKTLYFLYSWTFLNSSNPKPS